MAESNKKVAPTDAGNFANSEKDKNIKENFFLIYFPKK